MNPLVELRALSDKIEELEKENEAYRHSDKLLLDTLEQVENEILKVKKENARLLEIIKEYKTATTGLIDYVKLRELNEGKEE